MPIGSLTAAQRALLDQALRVFIDDQLRGTPAPGVPLMANPYLAIRTVSDANFKTAIQIYVQRIIDGATAANTAIPAQQTANTNSINDGNTILSNL